MFLSGLVAGRTLLSLIGWSAGLLKKRGGDFHHPPPTQQYDLLATAFLLSPVVRVLIAQSRFSSKGGAKIREKIRIKPGADKLSCGAKKKPPHFEGETKMTTDKLS